MSQTYHRRCSALASTSYAATLALGMSTTGSLLLLSSMVLGESCWKQMKRVLFSFCRVSIVFYCLLCCLFESMLLRGLKLILVGGFNGFVQGFVVICVPVFVQCGLSKASLCFPQTQPAFNHSE